ncbi:MAG: hypothetical protein J7K68_01135, partial [Candidatus Diapherotrites archaeon]|nr:hypothetical protein [Candidatus Diapherotrites archaeon]
EGVLGYDLYAEEISLKRAPIVGRENEIVAKVSNIGNNTSPAFNVSISVKKEWEGGPQEKVEMIDGLEPGSSVDITMKWTPDELATYRIKVQVSPTELGEDLTNNEITKEITTIKPPEKREISGDEFSIETLVVALLMVLSLLYFVGKR